MDTQNNINNLYAFQIQSNLLTLHLQLVEDDEKPKRSGNFETTYKNAVGNEVTIKRSPDGKFANKNGGAIPSNQQTLTVGIEKAFAKPFSDFADNIAKLPAKVQAAVRKAVFDSDFTRAIDKEAEKFIKSAYDPGLAIGFKLGQSIKDELGKTAFPDFAKTVAEKFAQFRKELPQKSEDLRREIIRIAKDPNTSTTIAAGALIGLAAYFHVTGLFKIVRAGQIAYGLFKIPKNTVIEVEKEFAKTTMAVFPKLSKQDTIEGATGIGQQAVNALKLAGAIDIGLHFLGASFHNIVSAALTSQAGRIIMNQAKKNEAREKEQLKIKIAARPENADTIYQELSKQTAKEQETRQKILAELQKGMPEKPTAVKPADNPLLQMPILSIKLTDAEEAYAADPKHHEQILAKAYKDEEILKLSFAYYEAQGLALVATLSNKEVGKEFTEIAEQAYKAINDRLAVVIKAEIKRLQEVEKQ